MQSPGLTLQSRKWARVYGRLRLPYQKALDHIASIAEIDFPTVLEARSVESVTLTAHGLR